METRSVEDVEKVIRHAKLNPEHLHPVSQNIYFGTNLLDHNEIRLMEVPARLADALKEGESLVIRGDGQDSAVVCSRDLTFDLKEAETSNGFLLIEDLQFHTQKDKTGDSDQARELKSLAVSGIFHRYLELKECKPRLNKLRVILSENLYAGPQSLEKNGPTMNQLLDRVQCSETELKVGLKELRAIQVVPGNYWHLLDTDYHMRILSHICNFVAENSWSYDNVVRSETVEALKELEPEFVVEQVFDIYFSPLQVGGPDRCGVHRNKLCRFFGEYLLQTGTTFDLTEFMSMWAQSMPEAENDDEGFQPELEYLRGLALVNTSGSLRTIRSFPESSLPDGVHERLETLFRVREKWSVDEIAPYVECLTTPILNVNGLLTKFARAANVDGKKMFCSKHGK